MRASRRACGWRESAPPYRDPSKINVSKAAGAQAGAQIELFRGKMQPVILSRNINYKNAMLSAIYENLCDLTGMTVFRCGEANYKFPQYITDFMKQFQFALMVGLSKHHHYYFVPTPATSIYPTAEKLRKIRKTYNYSESESILTIKSLPRPITIVKKVYPNLAILLSDQRIVFGKIILFDNTIIEHPLHIFAKNTKYVYVNPKKTTPELMDKNNYLARKFNFSVINPFDFSKYVTPIKPINIILPDNVNSSQLFNLRDIVKNICFEIDRDLNENELIDIVSKLNIDCVNFIFNVSHGVVKINDQLYEADFEELKKLLISYIKERFNNFKESAKKNNLYHQKWRKHKWHSSS